MNEFLPRPGPERRKKSVTQLMYMSIGKEADFQPSGCDFMFGPIGWDRFSGLVSVLLELVSDPLLPTDSCSHTTTTLRRAAAANWS